LGGKGVRGGEKLFRSSAVSIKTETKDEKNPSPEEKKQIPVSVSKNYKDALPVEKKEQIIGRRHRLRGAEWKK